MEDAENQRAEVPEADSVESSRLGEGDGCAINVKSRFSAVEVNPWLSAGVVCGVSGGRSATGGTE